MVDQLVSSSRLDATSRTSHYHGHPPYLEPVVEIGVGRADVREFEVEPGPDLHIYATSMVFGEVHGEVEVHQDESTPRRDREVPIKLYIRFRHAGGITHHPISRGWGRSIGGHHPYDSHEGGEEEQKN